MLLLINNTQFYKGRALHETTTHCENSKFHYYLGHESILVTYPLNVILLCYGNGCKSISVLLLL